MQTVVVASAHHDTSRELVNDEDFAVLYNVVGISLHGTVSLDSLIYVVEKGKVVRVHKVDDAERLFCLLNAALGKGSGLSLFVDDVVAVEKVVISLVVHFNNGNGL